MFKMSYVGNYTPISVHFHGFPERSTWLPGIGLYSRHWVPGCETNVSCLARPWWDSRAWRNEPSSFFWRNERNEQMHSRHVPICLRFFWEKIMAMSGSLFVGTVLCGFPYVHSASLWHLLMKLRDACNGLVCQRIWDPAISKHETMRISTVPGHQPNQSTLNTWRTSFTLNFNQLSSKYAVTMQWCRYTFWWTCLRKPRSLCLLFAPLKTWKLAVLVPWMPWTATFTKMRHQGCCPRVPLVACWEQWTAKNLPLMFSEAKLPTDPKSGSIFFTSFGWGEISYIHIMCCSKECCSEIWQPTHRCWRMLLNSVWN